MEDVLEVYQRPQDPKRPLVCMDETSKQQVRETREVVLAKCGQAERYDYEYQRNGVSELFMILAPLLGWRHVDVKDHRGRLEWAHCLKAVSDVYFAEAEKIVVVMDNLNTHGAASFYEAFPPEEARRLTNRFEVHYTPKHGSWLNMAETELSVLQRQCLHRRICDQPMLIEEVTAWEHQRNVNATKVDWRFTTSDARIKLKRLYPTFKN
jgi:DDE superfamily endonuclease